MRLSLIVLPHNTELQDALGDLDDLERSLVLGVLGQEQLERRRELVARLLEFGFGGVNHFDNKYKCECKDK